MIIYKICPYTYITFFSGVRFSRFRARAYNRESRLILFVENNYNVRSIHASRIFMNDILAAVQELQFT